MPIHKVVGVLLRQPFTQHVETFTTVAGARDDHLPVDRNAALVLDRRHEPRAIRIVEKVEKLEKELEKGTEVVNL